MKAKEVVTNVRKWEVGLRIIILKIRKRDRFLSAIYYKNDLNHES